MVAPMRPLVLDHPRRVALLAGELVANRLRARPRGRIVLPTGHTPRDMYATLRAHAADGSLPADGATLFQLDEYLGLGPGDDRSYNAYLRRELREIRFGSWHLLDGGAPDPEAECARHQALLDEAPIDLVVLGLGRDGHVAFDEPGTDPHSGVHWVTLDPRTRADAAAEFGGIEHVPTQALTVGLRTLRAAREILLLVTGPAKALALQAAVEADPAPAVPASLLRDHPRLLVVCDREAAAALGPAPGSASDRAIIVLGHREPGRSPEHRISRESHSRLRRGEGLARSLRPRLVLLTGYTRTGGLSEAEQMKADWGVGDVPVLLEDAGRNTAENASRSLPILRAVGEIRRVTVVTSAWHVRAVYFFAVYRGFGTRVSFRPAVGHGGWGRLLAQELRGLPSAPGQRRRALAEMRLPPELALPSSPSGAGDRARQSRPGGSTG
jgi:glucosamine-6-phosphate deaminase